MATKKQYALWCMQLIDGNDMVVDDVMEALIDDGFINSDENPFLDIEDDED
jgi:hypothetical protein